MKVLDADVRSTGLATHLNHQSYRTGQDRLSRQSAITVIQPQKFQRIPQPLWIFVLVVIAELAIVHLSMLLLLTEFPRETCFIIFIAATPARIFIFLFNSIYILGWSKRLRRAYFILDNNMLMALSAMLTYGFIHAEYTALSMTGISTCCALFFFMVGNYRVMITYCAWSRSRTIFYKVVRLYSCLFFLLQGLYQESHSLPQKNNEYLVFLFTTFAFYCELYFGMSRLQGSDISIPDYILKNDYQSQRMLPQEYQWHHEFDQRRQISQ